jgi:hypothetical protein
MTDQDRYEEGLEARIHAYVGSAGQDFDALALTRAAATARRPAGRWSGWLPAAGGMRAIVLALIVLVLAALGAIGITAATRLLDRRDPFDAQAPGTFALTGSMSYARYWHTAVRLADGRVLIIGGFPTVPPGDNNPPAPAPVLPAEIWDPATGSFTTLSSLSPANQGSSATLLRDGRVLIAGGRTRGSSPHPQCDTSCRLSGTALDTAVVFDPRTGMTTPVGRLNVPRFGHTAILLDDGRVLILGGWTGAVPDLAVSLPEPVASAELYDPASDTFLPAGSMALPIAVPTPDMQYTFAIAATLLPDGRVLVEDQIFDPATGSFHPLSKLDRIPGDPLVRYLTDNGGLLPFDPVAWDASGGQPPVDPLKAGDYHYTIATSLDDGRVLWTGNAPGVVPDAWIGDPRNWLTGATGPMVTSRLGHSVTPLADGLVLVVGGWTAGQRVPDTSTYSSYASLASAELYVPPPLGELRSPDPTFEQ